MLCLFHVNYLRLLHSWQSSHINFISSPTVPKCEGYRGNPGTPPPWSSNPVGSGCRRGDAHCVGDLQQLQHHGVSAHVRASAVAAFLLFRGCFSWTQSLLSRIKIWREERSKFLLNPHLCSEDLTYSLAHDSSWYLCVHMEFAKKRSQAFFTPLPSSKITSVSDGCVNWLDCGNDFTMYISNYHIVKYIL